MKPSKLESEARQPERRQTWIGSVVGHAEAICPLTDSQKVRILPDPLKWFLVGRQTYPEREKKRPLGALSRIGDRGQLRHRVHPTITHGLWGNSSDSA
jgi:hypothetical protein